MLAARMHDYKQPLVLEDIKIPEITPDQVHGSSWRSRHVPLRCTAHRRLLLCGSEAELSDHPGT